MNPVAHDANCVPGLDDHEAAARVQEGAAHRSLEELLDNPLEIDLFLRLAVGLAGALRELHAQGIIHRDVKPLNVFVDATKGRVWLTGFGIASRLRRERQAAEPPEIIAGSLPYMAPEQTGRMNRSVDSRSDLYSLGVTLYEMLTGSMPFVASDPMEWVHCHIARQPVPPAKRRKEVPGVVSAMVMKLLAKTPEERYQTAAGVESDLRHCLAAWEAGRRVDDFPLGEHDTPDWLLIPEKLYGRQREVETLLASFNRIVNGGAPELVLVSGYSGVGKSSVVNELHKALVPRRSLFASGKFDQYKRDIPYSTLAQAFQQLIQSLLVKSEAELSRWRDALREALEANGQLIVDLVPNLELIIGKPLPVPELSPQDAQRRFQFVFRRFIGVFARPEHPLALFLDDLQWLDAASLDLLEDLMTRSELQHLMLIGAYRDDEVTATHPLTRKLEAIRSAGAPVQVVSLAALGREDVGHLVADALRCKPADAAALVELVHEKTGGNPFFVIQFLSALADERLLAFDHDAARWSWDLSRIHAKGYTDNVVDLMVGTLSRLPARTQGALQQFACLGNSADPATLALVSGTSKEQIHADLWEAVRLQLIERLGGTYRFVHDRVQEAAYALIPEPSRPDEHLRIGRLLVAHTPKEEREEVIFEIVNQLNRGVALIASPDEREQLAELNLIAGKRAKVSNAYSSALTYLVAGAALLDGSWDRRHELIFPMEFHRAECEFLTGEWATAEQRLTTLASRAVDMVELATVTCLRMDLYWGLAQSASAVDVCLDYLRHLGHECPPRPTEEEVRREYDRIRSRVGSRAIETLIELPLMSDPASLATLDVLTKAILPAWFTDTKLGSWVLCKAVNLSLERGHSDGSCVAYEHLAMIAGPLFGDYKIGSEFGRLGYELVEKRGLRRFQPRTQMVFGNVILPWTTHLRAGRELVRQAFDAACRIGDLSCAAGSGHYLISNLIAGGDPLAEVEREAVNALEFATAARFRLAADNIATQLGLIRTLRGSTSEFGCLDNDRFNEDRVEQNLASNPVFKVNEFWYWTRKAQARFLAGNYPSAVDASIRAYQLVGMSPSFLETAECHFYGALSRAAAWDSASASEKRQHLEALAMHHRQLEIWAELCPENFENRAALVGAEIARIEGRVLDAMGLFELALHSARANGFIHNEALAYELAARYYAARGFEEIAHHYLGNARRGYLRWGADGKVRQLDELYPHLRPDEPAPDSRATIVAPVERLDLATVLKVSQTVSGEIVFEKLIDTLLRTAIEHAGATRGLLILSRTEELSIAAEAEAVRNAITVRLCEGPLSDSEFPQSVIRYAARTKENVILDDASAQSAFSTDDYLQRMRPRSVLCLPLVKQGSLVALLYLENRLASGVFTPTRIAVLEVLASQAAISLENSSLYRDLQKREAEAMLGEEKLRRSQHYLAEAQRLSHTGSWAFNADGFQYWSPELFKIYGLDPGGKAPSIPEYLAFVHPDDRDFIAQEIEKVLAGAGGVDFTKRIVRPDGAIRHVRCVGGRATTGGMVPEIVGTAMDVTEQEQAEEERRAHLWFLESMDRINRAMQRTNDVEGMMSGVLEEALAILGSDRAWLVYPCDPDAATSRVLMEHTRPEYPGAFAIGKVFPVDKHAAEMLRRVLEGPGAVTDLSVPPEIRERFSIQSVIAIAVRPKGDRPYLFGLHQCSRSRSWTAAERRLFEEIARRLEDALTSVLAHRNLLASEERYARAMEGSDAGHWDWNIVTDEMFLSERARQILVLPDGPLPRTRPAIMALVPQHPDDVASWDERIADGIASGRYEREYRVMPKPGEVRWIRARAKVYKDARGAAVRMTGSLADITQAKLAEEERREHLGFLESLDRVSRAMQRSNDVEGMTSGVLEETLAIFGSDRAWLGYPCDPDSPTFRAVMRHTRPEYPGAFPLDKEFPMDTQIAEILRRVLEGQRAATDLFIPPEIQERFGIQSMIAIAVRPKGDRPYLFGLHQCSHARVWTAAERRLFEEIARRLEDALTSVLAHRNLLAREEELRRSRHYLAEAQKVSHTGSWAWNNVTREIVYWSEECYRIHGRDPAQGLPSIEQVLADMRPDDARGFMANLEKLDEGREFEGPYRMVNFADGPRTVYSIARPVLDRSGRVVEYIGTVVDITERRRRERRLLAQFRVTQALSEASSLEKAAPGILRAMCEALEWDLGALWQVDPEGGVLRCIATWPSASAAAPNFAAATRAITFGPGMGLPGRVWSSGGPVCIRDVALDPELPRAKSAAKEGFHAAFAFPVTLKSGVAGVIELFSREVRDADRGLLQMMAAIGSQVAQFIERMRAKDALGDAREKLAQASKIASLAELSASIAHEINQPLQAIVANGHASLRWLDATPPNIEKAIRTAERVVRDGNAAAEVVSRIRALFKHSAPAQVDLDINKLILEVRSLMADEIQGAGVSLETELGEDLPKIRADAVQIQQVIVNLMRNGIEAMAEARLKPLLIRSRRGAGHVMVDVRDQGAGLVDPEKIFEPFVSTKKTGMGMGLTICRSIIEAHGGDVRVVHNEGPGVTFSFSLPIDASDAT